MLASFGLKESDETKAFIERFDLQSTPLPMFLFFAKGQTTPSDRLIKHAEADLNAPEVIEFVHQNLEPEMKNLKSWAEKFLSTKDKGNTVEICAEIVEFLPETMKAIGQYYLKTMQKIREKGEEFLTKEIERMKSLLESRSTGDQKKREFRRRISILMSFLKGAPTQSPVETTDIF